MAEVRLKHVLELGHMVLVQVGAGAELSVAEALGAAQKQRICGNQKASGQVVPLLIELVTLPRQAGPGQFRSITILSLNTKEGKFLWKNGNTLFMKK